MAPIDLHFRLVVLAIGISQAEGQSRNLTGDIPTDVGLWRKFLEAAVFKCLDNSHTPDSVRTISYSVEGLAASLSHNVLCSHIYYDSINNPGLGSIKSLCGLLTLVLNPVRNSDRLLGVYTISVPLLFYLNVSLLGFHMDPGEVEYPVCDWNHIVFKGSDHIQTTFCGRPYQQAIFTEGSTMEILTYHNYSVESKPSALIVSVEYQVSVRYPHDEGRSLHMLLHSTVLGHNFQQHVTRRYTYIFITEECIRPKSNDYYRFVASQQEVSSLPFVNVRLLQITLYYILGLPPVQEVDNIGFTEGLGYIQNSQLQRSCGSLKHNARDFFQTSPAARPFKNLGRYDPLDPDRLRKMPHSSSQYQYKFMAAHISSPDDQIWSVYLWRFRILPFNYTGVLRLNILSIYMPNQNCVNRQSDRITLFDGPYAGILTPSGIMAHFPMITSQTCSDVTKGDFYNGSVGDLTLVWQNQFGLNASIKFLYFIISSTCTGQSCSNSTFPLKLGENKLAAFSNPERPKFTIMKFSGMGANIKLRVLMTEYDLRNYDTECRLSGLFIFDNVLKMTVCSAMSVARFNLTMASGGIQFGQEVTICVKSYPQGNVAFTVEYHGTACYGLVNECVNTELQPSISSQCNPSVKRQGSFTYRVILPHNTQQSCCVEMTDIPIDHIYFWEARYNCNVNVIHPVLSSFNTTLSLFPIRQQCCGNSIYFEDWPQPLANDEYLKNIPLCSFQYKTVSTGSFHVELKKDFYLLKDMLQCGIKIVINAAPTVLHNICIQALVDESFLARYSSNQPLNLTIQPVSHCRLIRVDTNRPISLTIRQPRLFYVDDLDDTNVVTEFHANFGGMEFIHPIALQLEWSQLVRYISDTNLEANGCSWKLKMLIKEDTHLDLTDSVTYFQDTGVSITLSTGNGNHAFNISYARKRKRHIMRQMEHITFDGLHKAACFNERCYTGFDSNTENVSWQEAHDRCEARGHRLLSINSETEWLRLKNLLFNVDQEIRRCTNLVMIFLGLTNRMVGIKCCNITESILKCNSCM